VEFIKPFLEMSSKVLRLTKKAINAGLRDDLEPALKAIEDIYLDELMKSHDAHEGLTAFLEKRRPVWKDE
jgi:enoyl-CoA hydratase/carnithine racemase